MQIVKVSYMRRRNLGNYEHTEALTEVGLTEGECGDKAMEVAKTLVMKTLTGKAPTVAKTTTKAPAKKAEAPKAEGPVEKEVKKAPAKKAPAKKAAAKKPLPTKEEVTNALRAYAQAKDSKEMAQAVIEDVTGVRSLADVEEKQYAKLIKALAV